MDVLSDSVYEIVIIGGGTCGLACAARLCEDNPGSIYTEDEHQRFHWLKNRGRKVLVLDKHMCEKQHYTLLSKFRPQDILVLDANSDRFLGGWDKQFSTCQIPFLRLPMFFHPDPVNIDGMISYAHSTAQEKELMEIPNVVGREISKHKRKVRGKLNHDRPGIIDVNMRDCRDYYRPSTAFFHDFCMDLVDRYGIGGCVRQGEVLEMKHTELHMYDVDKTVSGFWLRTHDAVYGAKTVIVATGHRGRINYPLKALEPHHSLENACHTTHIFAEDVVFPHPRLLRVAENGRAPTLCIVGGGLTLAQLAHVACSQGIHVVLLVRGRLKVKHFDFHLDWVTKYKNVKKLSFFMLDTDEEREEMIRAAREGGSVNPEYRHKLQKWERLGRLQIFQNTEIVKGAWDGVWALSLRTSEKKRAVEVDMGAELVETVKEVFTKRGKLRRLSKSLVGDCGTRSAESRDLGGPDAAVSLEVLNADYIVCATGIAPDILGLPFMADIAASHPIPTVNGLPCLSDDLQWDLLPLFFVGKNAGLRIGPTAANLDGARLCAERVGWKIQESKQVERSPMDTRLQLAGNNMNWYSLLAEA